MSESDTETQRHAGLHMLFVERDGIALALLAAIAIVGCVDWVPQVMSLASPEHYRIDASAAIRLDYLLGRGARLGVDLIDPYGPLHFVLSHMYWPGLLLPRVLGRTVLAFALALVVWRLLGIVGWRNIVATLIAALVLVWAMMTGQDGPFEILCLLALYAHLLEERPTAASIVAVAATAMVALVKFPLFVLFAAMLGTVTIVDLLARKPPILLALGVAVFLGFWLLVGQNIADIWPWANTSLSLSSGFNDAMSLGFADPGRLAEVLFFAVVVVVLALIHYPIIRARCGVAVAFVTLLFFGLWSFVVIKHGIVRHDAHAAHTGVSLLLAGALFIALIRLLPQPSDVRVATAVTLLVIAGNFMVVRHHLGANVDPHLTLTKIAYSVGELAVFPRRAKEAAALHEKRVAEFRAMVGSIPSTGTIDQWPDNAAIAIFSGAEYRPRPMPFAYSVYSSDISRTNAEFLAGNQAPSEIVFDVASIDARFPPVDDALSWHSLLANYTPESIVGGHAVLRRAAEPRRETLAVLRETEAGWNEAVSIQPPRGQLLWAVVDIQQTILGRLTSLLYKGPPLMMTIVTRDGKSEAFRMVPSMMREGFLLSPALATTTDFFELFRSGGNAGREVETIRFELPGRLRMLYADRIRIKLSGGEFEPPLAVPPKDQESLTDSLTLMKESALPKVGIRFISIPGLPRALLSHSPSELALLVRPGIRTLSASFGMDPGSYAAPNEGDGVTFSIVAVLAGGERRELMKRHLDPAHQPPDAGTQVVRLALPTGTSRLLFVTDPGAMGNSAWDWSYWATVEPE